MTVWSSYQSRHSADAVQLNLPQRRPQRRQYQCTIADTKSGQIATGKISVRRSVKDHIEQVWAAANLMYSTLFFHLMLYLTQAIFGSPHGSPIPLEEMRQTLRHVARE